MFQHLKDYGEQGFSDLPLTEADLLVFATLAYCPMEKLSPQDFDSPVSSLTHTLYADPSEKEYNELAFRRRELWLAAAETTRFGECTLADFKARFSTEHQEQFAACAVCIAPDTAVVAFRGTDATLIGWKEDFNLSFESPVPAQEDALRFLEAQLTRFSCVYAVGHSKGGNLAKYAAAHCSAGLQRRICRVVNFDGPGLDAQTRQSTGYAALGERLNSYVPQESIIGMLMNSGETYQIIHSEGSGLHQHDTLKWRLEKGALVHEPELTNKSQFASQTLHSFLETQTMQERRTIVDAVFNVLAASGAQKLRQIPFGLLTNLHEVIKAVESLSHEQRDILSDALKELFDAGASHLDVLLDGERESMEV